LVVSALFAQALFAQGLSLRGLRGESLSESDLARGATVLVIWASWSPRGQDVVSRVDRIQTRWSGKCRVVMVNYQEDREAIERFLAGKSPTVPVLLDEEGAFAKKHAVTALPGLVVYKDGQVAFRGKLPDDPDRILADILG
jgi:thiol-disulfide isomerase/thioredoxin